MDPDGLADAGVPSDARPGSEDTDPTPGSAGLDGEGLDGEALGWEPACGVPGTGGPYTAGVLSRGVKRIFTNGEIIPIEIPLVSAYPAMSAAERMRRPR